MKKIEEFRLGEGGDISSLGVGPLEQENIIPHALVLKNLAISRAAKKWLDSRACFLNVCLPPFF